jgi:galactofuranosylgalactofuranosylrhamnosyl-N-acetylglucosaminyl-diphospho-decaprenol beta-1,5/1,6-galactofuranosyltransferase
LRQSVRRQRQVAKRFDELRRVYREALPVLSSKQKWETVLLSTGRDATPSVPGHHG